MLLTMMNCFEMIIVNETKLCVIRKALKALHTKSTIVYILLKNVSRNQRHRTQIERYAIFFILLYHLLDTHNL